MHLYPFGSRFAKFASPSHQVLCCRTDRSRASLILLQATLRSILSPLIIVSLTATCFGQFPPSPPSATTISGSNGSGVQSPADDSVEVDSLQLLDRLRYEIPRLGDPSFRARELARWRLEQHPAVALKLLSEASFVTDVNIGTEVVSLLSSLAIGNDSQVNIAAHEALQRLSGGPNSVTAVSYIARDALGAIAERQELIAIEKLKELDAQIGKLSLSVAGAMQNTGAPGNSNILYISDNFEGSIADIQLLRFIRSVDTAYLDRKEIPNELISSVAMMPKLKRLVLRGPGIRHEHLELLENMHELEHLEIVYAQIDDSSIPLLTDLPVVASLHMYGTKISIDGGKRLKDSLEDLNVYCGRGGFLGVQTTEDNLRVGKIVEGSGAALGGIRAGDLLTHVDSVPIKTFTQLREQLANRGVDETVMIQLERPRDPFQFQRGQGEVLTLPIVLGERPTEPVAR